MLVLTRRLSEQIIIGDHVRVTVISIRGEKVRLGIEAPKDIPVHRLEVYDAIRGGDGRDNPNKHLSNSFSQLVLDQGVGY